VLIKEKDTLFGLINYRQDISNSTHCEFRKDLTASTRNFLPDSIFGYFNDGKYFVSRKIETKDGSKTIFAEYLVKGTLNLYLYKDFIGDHYLMQKGDLPLKEITYQDEVVYDKQKPFIRNSMLNKPLIRYYMQDCPDLFQEIDQMTSAAPNEMTKLVKKYHDIRCPGDVCIIYKKKDNKFRVDLQVFIGLIKPNGSFFIDDKTKSNFTPEGGVLTDFWLPGTNERLFLRTGLIFSRIQESYYTGANLDIEKVGVFNYFKVPLQVEYFFSKKAVSPIFGAGLDISSTKVLPFFVNLEINGGLNFRLGNKIWFFITADAGFWSREVILPVDAEIVSYSVNAGLRIKI
jgi:hypothetical protein